MKNTETRGENHQIDRQAYNGTAVVGTGGYQVQILFGLVLDRNVDFSACKSFKNNLSDWTLNWDP